MGPARLPGSVDRAVRAVDRDRRLGRVGLGGGRNLFGEVDDVARARRHGEEEAGGDQGENCSFHEPLLQEEGRCPRFER